jgi:cysteine desulfurase/selenocysteine lyase
MFDAQQFKSDFPVLQQVVHGDKPLVYLDTAASSQKPQVVIDALSRIDSTVYANVHRGAHWLSDQSTTLYEEARDCVTTFIGAQSSKEIVFTQGTTAGINLVARCWSENNISAGDEIVLTQLEHHSNIVPWQQVAQRWGAVIRWANVTDDGQIDMEHYTSLLNEKTKIVAFTMCSNVLGSITPAAEIITAAHDADAIVMVDAAQAAPHQSIDVQQLDADFLAFSAHKMLGPSGIGILYGKQHLLASMPPFLGGGSMIDVVTQDDFKLADLPAKFEAGTPPISPVLAFPTAIDYLQNIGLESIGQHIESLVKLTHQQFSEIPQVKIHGPSPDQKSGIVNFTIAGVHPHDLTHALDNQGVAIRAGHHCAMPLHQRLGMPASARASFYLYNTAEDVQALTTAVNKAISLFC